MECSKIAGITGVFFDDLSTVEFVFFSKIGHKVIYVSCRSLPGCHQLYGRLAIVSGYYLTDGGRE